MKNEEVIDRILQFHPDIPDYDGCDGYKSGNPSDECTGVVSALVPTVDVIRKTAELGCEDSHFANPSGLNDDTQLTSVYDMALIASAAYKNDTLLTISKDKSYRLPATKNNPDGVTIQPEHKLLITTDTESPN